MLGWLLVLYKGEVYIPIRILRKDSYVKGCLKQIRAGTWQGDTDSNSIKRTPTFGVWWAMLA